MSICEVGRRTGWCGACYEGLRGRGTHRGHGGPSSCYLVKRISSVSYLKKPVTPLSGSVTSSVSSPSAFTAAFPALSEFLISCAWEDGSSRVPGTVMLLVEEGRWKAWLNDKAFARSAWVSGHTLEAVLGCLEAGLREESLEWRRARPERARR